MKNLLKLTLVLLILVSCKDAPESKESKIAEGLINEITGKNDNVNERYNLLMKDLSTKTSDKTVMGSFGDGTIRLEILDAAGENMTGAIIPLKMLHLNKITSEYNNTIRYSKKERNGVLTFGTDRDKDTKSDYQAELRFLYDNRFYVTLEGKAMNVDELWDAIDVDDLKRFKEFNK